MHAGDAVEKIRHNAVAVGNLFLHSEYPHLFGVVARHHDQLTTQETRASKDDILCPSVMMARHHDQLTTKETRDSKDDVLRIGCYDGSMAHIAQSADKRMTC